MSYSIDEIKAITFVRNAIHSPQDARHYMDVGRPEHRVTATIGGREIARSTRALKVKEVGRGVYDPVIYFPRDDVDLASLEPTKKSTHCPSKGDTTYFDLRIEDRVFSDVAWSYTKTIPESVVLQDLVAFDTSAVNIAEHTAKE